MVLESGSLPAETPQSSLLESGFVDRTSFQTFTVALTPHGWSRIKSTSVKPEGSGLTHCCHPSCEEESVSSSDKIIMLSTKVTATNQRPIGVPSLGYRKRRLYSVEQFTN